MKNQDAFNKHFYFDESSPTGVRFRSTGNPAGRKQYTKGSYRWVIRQRLIKEDVSFKWSLSRVLYEHYYNIEIPDSLVVCHADGNKDNHAAGNLILLPKKVANAELQKREVAFIWNTYRNVRLHCSSPDYYKAPDDWTEPDSLAALETEKEKRANGISKLPKFGGAGRKQRWK